MPKWTADQQMAIDGRSGSLLVSAAAGSGKTTVLVERVIQRLIDTENPCPANELVIVTFTRAAAAQMKERIEAALVERIAAGGGAWLMQQQLLLQSAKISTIDSFCVDLVRENFQQLDVSADFSVSDEGENERFSSNAMKAVLDEMYGKASTGFLELSDILSAGSSDYGLEEMIKEVYRNISSYPFPEDELENLITPYFGDEPIQLSPWGEFLLDEAQRRLKYCLDLILSAQRLLSTPDADPAAVKAMGGMVSEEMLMYSMALETAEDREWDKLIQCINSFEYGRFTSARKLDLQLKNAVKLRREKAKAVAKGIKEMLCCTQAEFEADRAALRPAVLALEECVKLYSEKLFALKLAEEKFDFNDIEHMALNLLVEKSENGEIVKTPLARSLSLGFREIMVDEYQDTNHLQDMLFSAVSRNEENLFFVGDVKQSIYRFRQAMPEIFLKRRDDVAPFDGKNYPARVTLGANFRSRNSVTACVNFLFEQLMSKQLGEITYDENEQLNAMASYPAHSQADVEFRLRRSSEEESEPEFVAAYVKQLLESGRLVRDGEGQRPIKAGDICVLTRYKKRMELYAQAMQNSGIQAVSLVEGEIGASAEIRIIFSLLKVLDNPLQDVALTGLMMSPVFGFTADDLAEIRTGVKKGVPVYRSVVAAARAGNKKCNAFLEKINTIRRIGIGMGAAEFLRRVYDETDIFALAAALDSPKQRQANLWSLLDRAAAFDSSGGCGLSALIRFIENTSKKGTEFGPSEQENAVKIMTVHKSKGLEFSVCILADLSASLSHRENGAMAFSRSFGPGLMLRDGLSGKSLKTLPFTACGYETAKKDLSEEIRILYVALTRAKELLVLVGTSSKPEEKLESAPLAFCSGSGSVDYGWAVTSTCYLDWLLPVFSRHMQACEFNVNCGCTENGFILKPGFDLKAVLHTQPLAVDAQGDIVQQTEQSFSVDEELAAEIKRRIDYEYPFAALNRAISKRQASNAREFTAQDDFFASSRPAFMNSGGFTAAQKGTLTHRFMQLCDFDRSDVTAQLEKMVEDGSFTLQEAEQLDIAALNSFYGSEFYQRIKSSPNIMREKKFAMLVPVTEMYPDLPKLFSDEKIVVQGMLDLAFEENGLTYVVDYKTDRGVGEQELISRHSNQLRIYAAAIERCTDCKVGGAYIYSLALGKEIKVF